VKYENSIIINRRIMENKSLFEIAIITRVLDFFLLFQFNVVADKINFYHVNKFCRLENNIICFQSKILNESKQDKMNLHIIIMEWKQWFCFVSTLITIGRYLETSTRSFWTLM
jgi:hypothetical protein